MIRTTTKILFFTIVPLFLLMALPAMAATIKTPNTASYQRGVGINRGLVGWWTFDGPDMSGTQVYDKSGGYATGTISGGVTKVTGKIGQAVKFDGASGGIATAVPVQTAPVTIVFWAKPGDALPVGMFDSAPGYQDVIRNYQAGKVEWWSGSPVFDLNVSANKWVHLAFVFTYDGTRRITYYKDGVYQSLSAVAGTAFAWTTFTIGNINGGVSGWYNGLLDDYRIYNRALSPSEIKQLYNLGLATTGATPNKASYRQNTGINSGLAGWWTFDGADSLLDKSAQGYSGSNVGNATYGLGKLGQAINLNGSTAYIDSGHDYSWTKTQPFSITTWFKMDDTDVQPLITKETYEYSLTFNAEGPNTMSFTYWDSGGSDSIRLTATAVTTNVWHHAVVTYDGANNSAIYLDGILKSTDTTVTANPFRDIAENTKIGFGYAYGGGPSKYFDGSVDEVRFYNRAISASEAKQLYAQGIATVGKTPGAESYKQGQGINSGLVGWWNFDGNNGTLDMSGRGKNGTISGGVTKTMGKLGQAYSFNGTSGRIAVAIDVSETAYAASLWFKTGSSQTGIMQVDCADGGTCGHDRHIYLNGVNLCARLYSNETICTTGKNYADNKWHHLVYTYGGTTGAQKIYADGILKSTGTLTASIFDWQTGIDIGLSLDATPNQYFSGQIDDVRIYNRSLSATDVQQLYQMGK